MPSALAERAEIRGHSRALSLGDPHHHGLDGPTLERWGVIANVDLDGLREELRR